METEGEIGKLSARPRDTTGKGPARRMRNAGLIPCVIYGGGKPVLSLTVDPTLLAKALDPKKKRNTVIALTVEGQQSVTEHVMLKEFQRHALKDQPLHADFLRVDLARPVRVRVPLVLEGKAEGVKAGGSLHRVFRDLEVECTPDRIPSEILGDVSPMEIGDALTVGDLKVPEGVVVCLPPQQTCALLFAPRKIEEELPAEAAASAEGAAAPAEGAETAAKGEEKGAE